MRIRLLALSLAAGLWFAASLAPGADGVNRALMCYGPAAHRAGGQSPDGKLLPCDLPLMLPVVS